MEVADFLHIGGNFPAEESGGIVNGELRPYGLQGRGILQGQGTFPVGAVEVQPFQPGQNLQGRPGLRQIFRRYGGEIQGFRFGGIGPAEKEYIVIGNGDFREGLQQGSQRQRLRGEALQANLLQVLQILRLGREGVQLGHLGQCDFPAVLIELQGPASAGDGEGIGDGFFGVGLPVGLDCFIGLPGHIFMGTQVECEGEHGDGNRQKAQNLLGAALHQPCPPFLIF